MKDRRTWEPPKSGERVTLRGRGATGTLKLVDDRDWAHVDWDVGAVAPKVCHIRELEVAS